MFYKKIINKEKLKTNDVLDDSIYNLILQKLFLYGYEDKEKDFDNLLTKAKNFTKSFFIQGELDLLYEEQNVSGEIIPDYKSFLHFSIQNLEDKYCKKIIDKINILDLKDKNPYFFNELLRDCFKNNKLEILDYLVEKNILTEQKINECIFLYSKYALNMPDFINKENLNDPNIFFNTLSVHTKNMTYLEKDNFWAHNHLFDFNILFARIKDLNFENVNSTKKQEMFDVLINTLYKNLKTKNNSLSHRLSSEGKFESYKDTLSLSYNEKDLAEKLLNLFEPFIQKYEVNLDKKYELVLIDNSIINISPLEIFRFEKLPNKENFTINYRNEYIKNKINNLMEDKIDSNVISKRKI